MISMVFTLVVLRWAPRTIPICSAAVSIAACGPLLMSSSTAGGGACFDASVPPALAPVCPNEEIVVRISAPAKALVSHQTPFWFHSAIVSRLGQNVDLPLSRRVKKRIQDPLVSQL